ncbi:hypothetical protein DEO23_03255 [Brachybacterium endophyticum]|uniref:Glycerophosphoryl diester phosphodiesterase membrane domain-containing protein n=2 Tax=Brachybacterium endophyticum TaxID=2182385 RepID=A0A2U2RPC5_9MICO|nr:hypothetical protein DEO23_03255 [Brachybacterium endophyticum]
MATPENQHPNPTASASVSDGHAPGTHLGADLGAALRFMWRMISRRGGALLPAICVYGAIALALDVVKGLTGDDGVGSGPLVSLPFADHLPHWLLISLTGSELVLSLANLVVTLLWTAACLRFGVDGLEGHRGGSNRYFTGSGQVIWIYILTSLAIVVGLVLLVVPGLVAIVLLVFAPAAAARGSERPFGASAAVARRHVGTTILGILMVWVLSLLTADLNVLDILAAPFTSLFLLGLYERLSGRELPDAP